MVVNDLGHFWYSAIKFSVVRPAFFKTLRCINVVYRQHRFKSMLNCWWIPPLLSYLGIEVNYLKIINLGWIKEVLTNSYNFKFSSVW
jgi:hypothetical protein